MFFVSAGCAFTMGNYLHHLLLFIYFRSVHLAFMLELKSDVTKDVSFAKMSQSFTAVEVVISVLVKNSFFNDTYDVFLLPTLNKLLIIMTVIMIIIIIIIIIIRYLNLRVVRNCKNAHTNHWLFVANKQTAN